MRDRSAQNCSLTMMKSTMYLVKLLLVASISALAVAQIPGVPSQITDVLTVAAEFANVSQGIVDKVCKVPPPADDTLAASKEQLINQLTKLTTAIQNAIPAFEKLLNDNKSPANLTASIVAQLQQLLQTLQTLVANIKAATSVTQLCTVIQDVVKNVSGQVDMAVNAFLATLDPCYKNLITSVMKLINVVVQLNTTMPQADQLATLKDTVATSVDPIIAGLQCLKAELGKNFLFNFGLMGLIDIVIQKLKDFKTSLNTITSIDGLRTALNGFIGSLLGIGLPG